MRTVVKICGNESQRGLQIVIFTMNGEIMIWINFNIQRIFSLMKTALPKLLKFIHRSARRFTYHCVSYALQVPKQLRVLPLNDKSIQNDLGKSR